MGDFLFEQLRFTRNVTLKAVEGITEDMANTIHPGFRNHILWNLGHIYLVQEKFGFQLAGFPASLTAEFSDLFANGTTPLNWTGAAPKLEDLIPMLKDQSERICTTFENQLDDQVDKPHTTSSGLTLKTPRELLNFTFLS